MTDTENLLARMNASGYKRSYIAKCVGLTTTGLMNKVNNKSDFRVPEIQVLCGLLKLSTPEKEAIFFANNVDNLSTKRLKMVL